MAASSNDFLESLTVQLKSANSSMNDVIHTPNDASYASLQQALSLNLRQTLPSPHRPLLILTPFHDHEIQVAVHCATKHGVQIRVRSGGHDFEGLSYTCQEPFIIVDMKNLATISIDTEDKTAWVQAGATLGQLYHAIAQKSATLAFTAGLSPTVGVGGHFSAGGYGMMSRKHALAADNIIDARLVKADGEIVDRRSMGEDHFWAIRGGGAASFGIILAFKVKLVTVPETVTVFNVRRSLEENATELVHRWQYIADKVDERLLIRLFLTSKKSSSTGKKTVFASFKSLFLGGINEVAPLMEEQFPELGLTEQDCTEMSWIESVLFFAGLRNQSNDVLLDRSAFPLSGIYFKGKSDYVTVPIPMEGLKGICRFLVEEDENMAEVQFSPYGGALSNFSEYETPFPHRSGNIYMIEYAIGWLPHEVAETERHMNWIRSLYRYMTPYVSKSPRAAYFNYRDLDLGMNTYNVNKDSYNEAIVWGFKYFKNNFERLVRVKTAVDPTNFFRNEQSIPPLSLPAGEDVDEYYPAGHPETWVALSRL